MEKILSLNDVMDSKAFVKGSVTFKTAREYIEPFLEKTSKICNDYSVAISGLDENANEDGTLNIAYGRVKVETKLPASFQAMGMVGKIGMVYGLDTQKPIIKVYTGTEVSACTNLTVFRALDLFQVGMLENFSTVYDHVQQYTDRIYDTIEKYKIMVEQLKNQKFEQNTLNQALGKLLNASIANNYIGVQPIISAARELANPKSMYHAKDGITDGWNLYNSITDHITHKSDILDAPSKTLMISNLVLNL